jgi:hypothetical protein
MKSKEESVRKLVEFYINKKIKEELGLTRHYIPNSKQEVDNKIKSYDIYSKIEEKKKQYFAQIFEPIIVNLSKYAELYKNMIYYEKISKKIIDQKAKYEMTKDGNKEIQKFITTISENQLSSLSNILNS